MLVSPLQSTQCVYDRASIENDNDGESGPEFVEDRSAGIVADRRELYNDQVYRYSTKISTVQAIVLAWLFRWARRDFFEVDPSDTARPDVELTPT